MSLYSEHQGFAAGFGRRRLRLLANFILTAFDQPYREHVPSQGGEFVGFAGEWLCREVPNKNVNDLFSRDLRD